MFACEPYHTPADVWALGMIVQWCLLLANPMGEMMMPEWEACISASPARLPVFAQHQQQQQQLLPASNKPQGAVAQATWPAELEPMAAVARRCLVRQPAERPSARQVQTSCQELLIWAAV